MALGIPLESTELLLIRRNHDWIAICLVCIFIRDILTFLPLYFVIIDHILLRQPYYVLSLMDYWWNFDFVL